ncbi:MAG: adenosine kinase [Desulfobacteraceae bacterium]|nr:adenosine kinase [Desulfobacteraceae bacterium]
MLKNGQDKKIIVGIGSALVDVLVNADDDFLKKIGASKGGMELVDEYVINNTLSQISEKPHIVPGGSACNTVVGVGKLGGSARFVGKYGKDDLGAFFENDLKKNNVEPLLFTSDLPTGRVLSIITPDAQRSMFTYLGASSEIQPGDITLECFADTAIVHIEGYLLFNRDLIFAALKKPKDSGALISLDLASYTVVEESKELLEKIIFDYVDILIANEDEARVFTGYTDELKAIESLSENVDTAVLKVGKRGSYIHHSGETSRIQAIGTGQAVDTTGAGDLWASGFLFGIVNGYSVEKCGELGSACGYEVCQVIGANIPDEGWQRIRGLLK